MTMLRQTIATLIRDDPATHGVYEETETVERTVFCTVRSASYRDIDAAGSEGMRPEIVVRLAQDFEYQDEKRLSYDGKIYNIDRVYYSGESDWVDLTCSRGEPDV